VFGLEHLGSTAVPGLAAKPAIDVDLTVADGAMSKTDAQTSAELVAIVLSPSTPMVGAGHS
jgi:GrpB-like predicted nucleotidyltransferase (UPF0157 family)